MSVAERTVKNNVSHLLRKLHLSSRTQIAVLATRIRDQQTGTDHCRPCGARVSLGVSSSTVSGTV